MDLPLEIPEHWETLQPEKVAEGFGFPEGASAAPDGSVFLVNCDNEIIHRVSVDGSIEVFAQLPGKGNGSKRRENGNLVVCDYAAKCLMEFDSAGNGCILTERDTDGKPFTGPNDVCIARNGDLYFTSPQGSDRDHPIGKVYHYAAATGATTVVAEGLAFPNGLSLSATEDYLYIAETFHSRIWRFPVLQPGVLGAGRIFAQLPGLHYPDGIDFDAEGWLYVAYYGSATIVVLDQGGDIVAQLPAGGKNPTNLSFGGPSGDWLYVTEAETNTLFVLKIGRRGFRLPGWE
jgi:gluconolactonase